MAPISLRYVVPVHNDATVLAATTRMLCGRLRELPGHHHVLLVENGSRDESWARAKAEAGTRENVEVHAHQVPTAGLGFALDHGIREAGRLAADEATGAWIVLTGSDLPFDFTDLDAFLAQEPFSARMYIGSKAHPDSVIPTTALRTVMSALFQAARYAALGMRTRDSQGTFIVQQDLALALAPLVLARDYFYTTELVHFAERRGERVVELPVRLAPSRRPSTVHPLRDGTRMLRALVALRRRTL